MTTRLIDQEINLPAEFKLPHPADLADSPAGQQAALEQRAVRILRDLSTKASNARERLEDAKSDAGYVTMLKVDQMIAAGQVPVLPGVVRDTVQSATVLAEKTALYAEQGLQLVKMHVQPTSAVTSLTTLVYIDPKVTTLETVKAQMLEQAKAGLASTVRAKQAAYDDCKSLIERFHKHYVQRQKQVTSVADMFKAAKEI